MEKRKGRQRFKIIWRTLNKEKQKTRYGKKKTICFGIQYEVATVYGNVEDHSTSCIATTDFITFVLYEKVIKRTKKKKTLLISPICSC